MVIGGGGREYGIAKKLSEDPRGEKLYVLPGNGGMEEFAECVNIRATDLDGVCEFASKHDIGFAVVTPDDPLAMGMADRLRALHIPCFGPSKAAARIESSKIFSKKLMEKYGIPTAKATSLDSFESALEYLSGAEPPMVVKADGLALGKGVFICRTHEEAEAAVRELMENRLFGRSGDRILIEEFLEGPEVSVLSFTDGKTLVPMVSSMDHKTVGEGGTGPNTGGMGVIAPNPYYTPETAKECMERIFMPTIRAMEEEGCPFSGCLYFGLMITKDGPKVIEYNCRFGDPETQVVLPLLKSDLLDVMTAVTEERLSEVKVEFSDESVACVIIASGGYPQKYEKGFEITIPEEAADAVYVAGAVEKDGKLYTSGGRVLGVARVAGDLKEALRLAYADAEKISFEGSFMRHDIGARALKALEN